MRMNSIAVLLAGLIVGLATAQQAPAAKAQAAQEAPAAKPPAAQQPSPFKTPTQKRSYALGMDLGSQLRKNSMEVDIDLFNKGFKDAISGSKTLLTEEEARAAVIELNAEQRQRMLEARKAERDKEAAKNKKEGEAFLAENKKKEGVVTLPSGLQYKILKTGEGKKPTAEDTVACNFRGTLVDGTEFDTSDKHRAGFDPSDKRNQPRNFPVKSVIKGWTEALQLMPVGSKWQLFIPSDLAYGEVGAGTTIGPNATLIFEVELLSIGEKSKAADQKY